MTWWPCPPSISSETRPSISRIVSARRSRLSLQHRTVGAGTSVSVRRLLPRYVRIAASGAASHRAADRGPFGHGLEAHELHRGPGSPQHALEQASMDGTDQLTVFLQQVSERTLAQRDLDRPGAAATEARLEPGIGQRLLQHREVGPRGPPASRLLHAAAHQVGAPFAREFLRTLALA